METAYENITDKFPLQKHPFYIEFLLCSFYAVAFLVGAPGNILIIRSVLVRKNMQNSRNYFIVNLACCDITALLTSALFFTLSYGSFLTYIPEALCKIAAMGGYVLMTVSMTTHVAIALERRRAIVFPLVPKPSSRKIKNIILIIWIVPTIFYSLVAFGSRVYGGNVCMWRKDFIDYLEFIVGFYILIIFLLPVGILTWSYLHIISSLRKNHIQAENSLENKAITRRFKHQRKAVRCLMALVSAFVLLNLPYNIGLALVMRQVKYKDFKKISYYHYHYILIALCINFMVHALNPIILYLGSTEYRLAFNETFKQWMVFCCRMSSCCKRETSVRNRQPSIPVVPLSFKITASKRDG